MTVRVNCSYKTVVSPCLLYSSAGPQDPRRWKVTLWYDDKLIDGGLFEDYGECWIWAHNRRRQHAQGLLGEEGSAECVSGLLTHQQTTTNNTGEIK